MRNKFVWLAVAALALCVAATPARAQGTAQEMPAAGHEHHGDMMTPSAMPDSGLKKSFLGNFDDASSKLVALAEAFPQDKYTWRPAEGVRSVSEVFMHVAGGNYFIPRFLGTPPPEGLSREMEKETDKAKVVAALKASIAHARGAIEALDLADLGSEIELFGEKATKGDALLILIGHAHEHLGQSIAYARSNGVVPPWSVPPPAAAPAPADRRAVSDRIPRAPARGAEPGSARLPPARGTSPAGALAPAVHAPSLHPLLIYPFRLRTDRGTPE